MKLDTGECKADCQLLSWFQILTFFNSKMVSHFLSITHALNTADTAVGRVNIDMLPDQAAMELLIEGLTPTFQKFVRSPLQRQYKDVCSWHFVTCDEAERVTDVNIFNTHYGEINIDFLPRHVRKFTLRGGETAGTLQTDKLPDGLEVLKLNSNKLYGSVAMERLPPELVSFDLGDNLFQGTCDVSNSPQGLTEFIVRKNKFTGEVLFSKLPRKLRIFDIERNSFSGSAKFENLPPTLLRIDISRNSFSGELELTNIPQNLKELCCSHNALCGSFVLRGAPMPLRIVIATHNNFSGTAVVPSRMDSIVRGIVRLTGNSISVVVDENGEEHRVTKSILHGQVAIPPHLRVRS